MAHSDDNGVVMPPRVAPAHVVLLPILKKGANNENVIAYARDLAEKLRSLNYHGTPLRVELDDRDIGGTRNWEWIKKGIPLRVEIGPKDIANDAVYLSRRDRDRKDSVSMQKDRFVEEICGLLDEIQDELYNNALEFREQNTRSIDGWDEFKAFFTPENTERPEIHGGFAKSHWCGKTECETAIKDRLNVTIRCIPFDAQPEKGKCIECGAPAQTGRVVFAKAY